MEKAFRYEYRVKIWPVKPFGYRYGVLKIERLPSGKELVIWRANEDIAPWRPTASMAQRAAEKEIEAAKAHDRFREFLNDASTEGVYADT